ncbi:bifunctional cytidylate kinase/GTPase Der [Corynebacterium aquilae]|uniref:Multifunctional fusion protein n=1 Tax=Corynebacterium aquilae DSM 44791 TaxID=1431546 RepID=A0A1L7CFU5_9CORY|nr:bifunctional cytidylate kinase/GTPase Der [Corynebacterium aquilae]APT84708.1 cytidylate kinase [Corynebacterium aquilae DSM 44791]
MISNIDNQGLLVAVDGPSGAGKSTACRAVARALDAKYLDTGAMYRVATLHVLNQGIDPADTQAVIAATAQLPLTVNDDPDSREVLLGGVDVSADIRTPEVTTAVSAVSAIPAVRENLVAAQRDLAARAGRCVLDGRDIGTNVFPDAPAKIFLTASAQVRARRRHNELEQAGHAITFEEVLADVERRDHLDSTRATNPLAPADDAYLLDSSDMSLDEVIATMLAIIEDSCEEYADNGADDDYEELSDTEYTILDESDFDESEFGDADFGEDFTEEQWQEMEKAFGINPDGHVQENLCTVAIVGRPNVGKSSLVNRFLGRREAVVEDFPGVTRDRISYIADWGGRRFWVQDTGGWDPDAKGIHGAIARQAETAMATADVIVFVVDTKVGITETDEVMARKLQRSDVPVILVANKFDSDSQYGDMAEFYALGLGDPYPVSAQHGRGGADVLDQILKEFPDSPRHPSIVDGPRRVALVGKPNVGKSSLLNKISGEERSVVDNVAGTTVDPVDSLVQLDQQLWKFIDTAGLRRKVKNAQGHEYYASLRTKSAIDAAEVCVFMLDASEPVSEQDQKVLNMIVESGRALVIAFNKWDLMDEDRRELLDREIDLQLAHIPWARRINISAKTGRALQRLEPAMIEALESWDQRVTTGQLNNWLRQTIAQNPPPMRGGRLPRVLFATQASTRPPVIVLFTTGFLEAGYRRYLERRFRETFGFEGSPVRIAVRVREKRKRK